MESSLHQRERGWKLVNVNTVILICSIIGLVMTAYEKNSSVSDNLETLWKIEIKGFQKSLLHTIKWVLTMVVLIKRITKELYIATYIVMIYAFSGGNKGVILPWLIVSAIRSIFLDTLTTFTGFFICAHYQIKYTCVDFVISKAVSLACSTWLWALVYEGYVAYSTENEPRRTGQTRTQNLNTGITQVRSLDSVLAEAVVDWFLEEADRCRRFDSKLAVDEDIMKFEEELGNRASKFLDLSPQEILQDALTKLDHSNIVVSRIQSSTQTETICNLIISPTSTLETISMAGTSENEWGESDSRSNQEVVENKVISESHIISEVDMENKNPLRKFPYLPRVSITGSEFGGDTVIGNKCASVQTDEDVLDASVPPNVMLKHAKKI